MRQGWRGFPLVLSALIVAGTLAGLAAAYRRYHIEERNRRVEIALEWDEVWRLAQVSRQPLANVLAQFRAQGVSTLVLQEETLAALEQAGATKVERSTLPGGYTLTRIEADSEATLQRILQALQLRAIRSLPEPAANPASGEAWTVFTASGRASAVSSVTPDPARELAVSFAVPLSYLNLRTLGVGLPTEALAATKAAGLRIAGRIANFPGVNLQTAQQVLAALQAQGVTTVIFSGDEVLGYRGLEKEVASLFRDPNAPDPASSLPGVPTPLGLTYGAVEFGKQKGDEKLSATLYGDYARVHSIQTAEMAQLDAPDVIERFVKAARERNIRFCYVRLFTFAGDDPVAVNTALLQKIAQGMQRGNALTGGGFDFGAAGRYPETELPRPLFALLGLGTAAGAVWMVRLFGPLPERWQRLLLLVLGAVCAGLAAGGGETGRRFLALLAGIVFPTAACLRWMPMPHSLGKEPNRRDAALVAALTLFCASATTALGIAHVVGLLATRPFMLRANQFLGIKAQHAVPLAVVLLVVVAGGVAVNGETWERYKARVLAHLRAAYSEPARFGTLLLALVALAGLALVIARTGNESGVGVSGIEMKFRALLDRVLPARPRTKEFLIGHPAFVLGIAWWLRGRRHLAAPAYIIGSLGQTSLLNTFCHIHTPLIVSLWRGTTGLILGALAGMALFLVFEALLPPPTKQPASA